ncbi:MAG TPA: BadF/BadG/BcrA/BcrD ATPase family protein [Candidatus Baltobacteraceae bacterium]
MTLFAGIDGGQSSTVAVIGGKDGRVLARGIAGAADEVAQARGSTRLHDALNGALEDALRNADLPLDSHFDCVVAGISGYEGKVHGLQPQVRAGRLHLVHDTVIAHAGALDGKPGVVVIAGTGSVAYAVNDRAEHALAGGWGYLFGDEGSAFWLVRETLADAMRARDSGEVHALEKPLLEHFRQPSLRALARAFYTSGISRGDLAAAAPLVLAYESNAGDAAAALVALAKHAAARARLEHPEVAFVGGLLRRELLNETLDRSMRELMPRARRVQPKRDAAEGALLLAYRQA